MLAALGLGVWVFVAEPRLQSTGDREKRGKNIFQEFSRSGLNAIELEPVGGPRLRVERVSVADTWNLFLDDAPTDGDEAAIDKLAAAIEYASVVREATGSSFGLETPRLRGAIRIGDVRQEFSIGSAAPGAPGTAYVRVGDGAVQVASAAFVVEVLATASRLVERRVVPYLSVETSRLEVGGGSLVAKAFERVEGGAWLFAGERARASRRAIDRLWSAIADLQSEKERPDSAWAPAADDDVVRVRLIPRDGRPAAGLELHAGCMDASRATLRLSGPKKRVVCVASAVYEKLKGLSAEDFRDAAPVALRSDEIQAIRIVDGSETFEVGRKGPAFLVRSDGNRSVPSELNEDVNAWMDGLSADAEDAVDDAQTARLDLTGILEVYTDKVKPAESLHWVRIDANTVVLKRDSDAAMLRVRGGVAARMSAKGAWLRPRAVFEAAAGARAVTRLELVCDGRREVVEHGSEGWVFVEPKGAPVDAAHALDVAAKLLATRADRWLETSEKPGGSACFGRATLAGQDGGGAGVYELQLGDRREGAYVASASGAPGAFLAPTATRELLTASLVDRVLGPGDLDGAASVTLRRGARSGVFVRTSRGLRLRGAEENGPLGERLTARVASLLADEVLHAGEATSRDGLSHPAATIEWAGSAGNVLGQMKFGAPVARGLDRFIPVASPRGGVVLGIRPEVLEELFEAVGGK